MKQNGLVLAGICLVAVLTVSFLSIRQSGQPLFRPAEQLKGQVARQLDSLDMRLEQTLLIPAANGATPDELRRAFLDCRRIYKGIEPFSEYFFPATSRLINGPPLPEIEAEENKAFEPEGFQVIEELLYPEFDTTQREVLTGETRKLRREVARCRQLWAVTEVTDAHVFDALRLQVFRILTLGISGFDTPLCQAAIPEAAVSMQHIRLYLHGYAKTQPAGDTLIHQLEAAVAYLNQHPDFNSFDRARFIRNYANPVSEQLLAFQQKLSVPVLTDRRPLRPSAATLFENGAFDADAYATTADARMNPAKVALGRKLFFDPVLSGNSQRSCAGCHQPGRAFTDGLVKSKTLTGDGLVARNTPTLLNAALQAAQFYDMRTPTLESQSFDVVHNTGEMNGSLRQVAADLQRSPAYVALFKKAFPAHRGAIEPAHIQNALAAYERTLVSLNSRFDHYMRGNDRALSAEEVYGFNLFMGKAKCGICHFMPLFNGTVPPTFAKTESEVIGVPAAADNKKPDTDIGRYAYVKVEPLKYAFKTPTLRHIGQTAPYMHNGVYRTLEEVVDFYDQGGGTGLGFVLDNQTLPAEPLKLTKGEKKALVAFLKAL
ncbi:cytochrome-c peroxidase [Arsenicibacter rosenii]|uniref:Cytochrome C peroxidase n=1 Tax=Arsenicibacter rosenii TaxID=1750698 RepID=A0A1S2VK83_9BACT|nr:cytochrome c peroxidase [Arsenicibacter rosenii]OIN59172.1 cytochrome C peroxidase [Arsenicibacter rosenii]